MQEFHEDGLESFPYLSNYLHYYICVIECNLL